MCVCARAHAHGCTCNYVHAHLCMCVVCMCVHAYTFLQVGALCAFVRACVRVCLRAYMLVVCAHAERDIPHLNNMADSIASDLPVPQD